MTCEDRNYRCCELNPTPEAPYSDEELEAWYEPHVQAWENGLVR